MVSTANIYFSISSSSSIKTKCNRKELISINRTNLDTKDRSKTLAKCITAWLKRQTIHKRCR